MTSDADDTPPIPMIGMETAFFTCHIIRTATGNTAGPEKPPVLFASTGLRRLISIRIPSRVLMSASPSAPASSAAFAIDTISVTFGDSLIYTGLFVTSFTAFVTAATFSQLVPKAMPPPCTFGQETFTSRMPTASTWSIASASFTYSGIEKPEIFATSGL